MTNHDTPAIRIASTRPGLWRCGVQHPGKPVEHPAGTFSPEQIERLRAEPALVVDVLTGGGGPAGNGTAAASDDGPAEALTRLTPDQIDAISGMSEEELDRALGIAEHPARKEGVSVNADRKARILCRPPRSRSRGRGQLDALGQAADPCDRGGDGPERHHRGGTRRRLPGPRDSLGAEGQAAVKDGHATT